MRFDHIARNQMRMFRSILFSTHRFCVLFFFLFIENNQRLLLPSMANEFSDEFVLLEGINTSRLDIQIDENIETY